MKKNILLILILLAVFPCFVSAASLEEILSSPAEFDSKAVEVEGEAIGSPLKEIDGTWINIKSGESNIGVFSSDTGVLEKIEYWGSYREKGDKLKVEGVFYKNCPLHQISDIHLTSLNIIEKGRLNEVLVSAERIKLAIILFIICLTTGLIYLIKKLYENRKS